MCEFCTEHGEGRKWYLEAKNYSREMFHAPLTPEQREAAGASTRAEYLARFCDYTVRPALTGERKNARDVAMAIMPGMIRRAASGEMAGALEDVRRTHYGQVVTLEDAVRILDAADAIVRIPCGCRYLTTGKTDKRYCFGLGIDASGVLAASCGAASLEVLTADAAKRIVRDYDGEGLVHTVWTGISLFVYALCNCDRDCLAYRSYILNRGMPLFFRGESVAEADPDLCSGCRECVKQCQFGAQSYSSALGKIYIDGTRCFGCGVCRSACPNDAIRMAPRQGHPVAGSLW